MINTASTAEGSVTARTAASAPRRPRIRAPVAAQQPVYEQPVMQEPVMTSGALPRQRRMGGGLFGGRRRRQQAAVVEQPVVQRRRASIGEKITGALMRLQGSLTGRPGLKVRSF